MNPLTFIRNLFVSPFDTMPVSYTIQEITHYNMQIQIKSIEFNGVRKWRVIMDKWVLSSYLRWQPLAISHGAYFDTKELAYDAIMEHLLEPRHTLYENKDSEILCMSI